MATEASSAIPHCSIAPITVCNHLHSPTMKKLPKAGDRLFCEPHPAPTLEFPVQWYFAMPPPDPVCQDGSQCGPCGVAQGVRHPKFNNPPPWPRSHTFSQHFSLIQRKGSESGNFFTSPANDSFLLYKILFIYFIGSNHSGSFLRPVVKESAKQEMRVQPVGGEDPLKEEMAIHQYLWEIP